MENLKLPKAAEIKYFEQAEYKRKVESAKHRMRPKPFTERFNKLNTIAKIGTFFFPLISILTAIAFLFGYIYDAAGYFYISIVIAVIILTLLETTKNHLFSNALDTYFSNSGKTLIIFLFALLFSMGSFIMSYQGAELLVIKLDNAKAEIEDSSGIAIENITLQYESTIEKEKAKILDLKSKAKRQWRGLNTLEQNKLILAYEENIRQLRGQKQKEIEKVLSNEEKNLADAESNTEYNSAVFKVFAGINEFLTILSIAFCAFYAFKTVRQDLDINDYQANPDKYAELPGGNNFNPISINQSPKVSLNQTETDRKVINGFLRQQNSKLDKPPNIDRITLTVNNHRSCKNCGNKFEFKHWNKQYCSDEWRIAFWEQKTGKKLKLKKAKV